MRNQVDFSPLLKLQKICYFGLWPQKTLGQSVCIFFLTFNLFDLLILIQWVHCYIVLVFMCIEWNFRIAKLS